jgi:large subunit ribosomal protein L4
LTESAPEVQVRNLSNEVVETLPLSSQVFDYQASESLLWEAVTAFLAGRRKGSHSTKTRAEVRGGGRKPWRQKGTGRARAGTIRSPLWRSGGVTFGPKPRNYAQSLPKKKRRGAVKLVLSDKLKNEKLLVLDSLELSSHKTRNFVDVMGTFDLTRKLLVVDSRENRNLFLSTRNLPDVKMVPALGVNVYDLLNAEVLMISKASLLELQEVLQRS